LVGVFVIAPAKADTFDFSFGVSSGGPPCSFESPPCASGTFTTDGAASDPGFELITGLTFNVLQGETTTGFPFIVTNEVGKNFAPGAAFNPTTRAFVNHSGGRAVNDIGGFQLEGKTLGSIEGLSFAEITSGVSGNLAIADLSGEGDFEIDGGLDIRRDIGVAPVPEASTWAMLLLGFAGLGLAVRRRRLGAVLSSKQEG
jgi:hypothetical protein